MRRISFLSFVVCWLGLVGGTTTAPAASCPGNPDAIGTSRTLVVDPVEHPLIGIMQYPETLPLLDHEVVLTFDDGPLPPNSNHILDILASQCVKATYFLVGRMAHEFPKIAERIYAEGHTIGTHSENHPLTFQKMPIERAEAEIDDGIAAVGAALGNPKAVAPFFRIPGLLRAPKVEAYLESKSLMTFSSDFVADDWKHISAEQIVHRALTRLEARGRGILLLHDIHPATVKALPTLLHELKQRGYRIVQVVPANPDRPKTVAAPELWASHPSKVASSKAVETAPAAGTRAASRAAPETAAKAVAKAAARAAAASPAGEIIDLPHPAGPKAILAQPAPARTSLPAASTVPTVKPPAAGETVPATTASVSAYHAKADKLRVHKPGAAPSTLNRAVGEPAPAQPSSENEPAPADNHAAADADKPSFLSALLSQFRFR